MGLIHVLQTQRLPSLPGTDLPPYMKPLTLFFPSRTLCNLPTLFPKDCALLFATFVPQTSCEKWSKEVLLWCVNYLGPRQAQWCLWPQLNYSNVNQVAALEIPLA